MSKLRAVNTPDLETDTRPIVDVLASTQLENALLRIEILQVHLQSRQAEMQALVKSLERPGYLLQRAQDGQWFYQLAPPEPVQE